MKLPVVITYLKTPDKGQELRTTLRTLKNIKNWDGKVFVVGNREDWFNNKITHIETARAFGKAHMDRNNKLRKIIADKRIPDDFIYTADDVYIMKPMEVKAWHAGEITTDHGFSTSAYKQIKWRTRNWLKTERKFTKVLDYDLHTPMILNKKKLAKILDICDQQHPDFELHFRTLYGNIYKIGGEQRQDGKYVWDSDIVSTSGASELEYLPAFEASPFEPAPPRSYSTSVLMALYNTEQYVRRALDSIPKIVDEIIVCDDASTDDSRAIVKQWQKDNPDRNLKLLTNKTNKGVGHTKNKLLDNATKEYSTFLDSDDYFYPAITRVIAELDGSDIVYYDLIRNDDRRYRLAEQTKLRHPGEVKFIKREFIGTTRNDGRHYAEDWSLYSQLVEKNPSERFTGILAKHYEYPREGSQSYKRKKGLLNVT